MIRQYKLTNGDELLAEVVEYVEEEDVILARNTMKLVCVDDHNKGVRYYTFRPWMVYQDNQEYIQTISYSHIIGEAKPNPLILGQYNIALKKEMVMAQDEEDDNHQTIDDLDDDSIDDNIIKFNKDKLH